MTFESPDGKRIYIGIQLMISARTHNWNINIDPGNVIINMNRLSVSSTATSVLCDVHCRDWIFIRETLDIDDHVWQD